MDFDEILEQADESTLQAIGEVSDLLNAYVRHVMDGVHEAVTYRIGPLLQQAMSENFRDLFRTGHHLLADDPSADDVDIAEFGNMLGEANMNAAVSISEWLDKHESTLAELMESVVRSSVEEYEHVEFSDPSDDADDMELDGV